MPDKNPIILHGLSLAPVRELVIIVDTREGDISRHPWTPHFPKFCRLVQGTLETGDFALAGLQDGVVVERKAVGDLMNCYGSERPRFMRELQRGRYCDKLVTVCEGSRRDMELERGRRFMARGRAISNEAISGNDAALFWRYGGVFYAGSPAQAVDFTWRILALQLKHAREVLQDYRFWDEPVEEVEEPKKDNQ